VTDHGRNHPALAFAHAGFLSMAAIRWTGKEIPEKLAR